MVILLIISFGQTSKAKDFFKAKQHLSKHSVLYYIHAMPNWNGYLIYKTGDKSWLHFGLGPRFKRQLRCDTLLISAYHFLQINTAKKHWPIANLGTDLFIIYQHSEWVLFIRTLPMYNVHEKDHYLWAWGRDYLGYQISDSWQWRLQTEWRYQNEYTQSIGPAWEKRIAGNTYFSGYLAVEVNKPNSKTGWLEIKIKY